MTKQNQPEMPNVADVAKQQFKLGKKAAKFSQGLGAINQTVPGGSLKYNVGKHGGIKGVKVKLDPGNQEFYNAGQATRNMFLQNLPTDEFEMPDMARSAEVEKAYYDRGLSLINPQLEEADKMKRLELEERGIPLGSEIYTNENSRLGRQRESALTSLARDAKLAGGSEQDRLMAMALSQRNQPFNEFASFMSGSPMTSPQFQGQQGYSVGAPDITTPTYNQYNQQVQQANTKNNSIWNGILGLGSAAAMGFA